MFEIFSFNSWFHFCDKQSVETRSDKYSSCGKMTVNYGKKSWRIHEAYIMTYYQYKKDHHHDFHLTLCPFSDIPKFFPTHCVVVFGIESIKPHLIISYKISIQWFSLLLALKKTSWKMATQSFLAWVRILGEKFSTTCCSLFFMRLLWRASFDTLQSSATFQHYQIKIRMHKLTNLYNMNVAPWQWELLNEAHLPVECRSSLNHS